VIAQRVLDNYPALGYVFYVFTLWSFTTIIISIIPSLNYLFCNFALYVPPVPEFLTTVATTISPFDLLFVKDMNQPSYSFPFPFSAVPVFPNTFTSLIEKSLEFTLLNPKLY